MPVSLKVQRKKGKMPPQLQNMNLKIGFPRSKSTQANIMKAVWNEFGTRRIPERPFLRTSMDRLNIRAFVNLDGLTGVHLRRVLDRYAAHEERE